MNTNETEPPCIAIGADTRRPYVKPKLVVHGHLRNLVQGGGGSDAEDSVGSQSSTIVGTYP